MSSLRPGVVPVALAALLTCWPQLGRAGSLELQVAPLPSRSAGGPCPPTLSLVETPQPYREGSYAVAGRAALGAITKGWRLVGRDAFSATWVAALRTPYQRCTASAGIVRVDNTPSKEHSYLRLRFSGGEAQLILDMTGLRDPNGYTPAIFSAGLREGEPVWSWGGSD